jgi:glycosyltransferase involved in cell wall biosynthesis
MCVNISIIVCCFNSGGVIKQTLRHLANQRLNGLLCELILVDNNCIDNTLEVVQSTWASLNTSIQLNVISEHKPGQSHARKAGVAQSKGEVIVFCDDDNRLNADYVDTVFQLLKENKNIGLVAGTIIPSSTKALPEWFPENQLMFACGNLSEESCFVSNLWGAGLSGRGELLRSIYNSKLVHVMNGVGDKLGNRLAGDDNELCFWVKRIGFKLYYSRQLVLYHFMHASRLNLVYLNNLRESTILGNKVFRKMQEFIYHFERQFHLSDFKYLIGNNEKGIAIRAKFGFKNFKTKIMINNIKELNTIRNRFFT